MKTCSCETPQRYEKPSGIVICLNTSCGMPIVTFTLTRPERP